MKTRNFPHHFLKDFDLSVIPSFACALLVNTQSPFQILGIALLLLFIPSSTLFPLNTAMHDLVPVFFATSLFLTLTEVEALPPSSLEEVVTLAVSPLPACLLVLLQGLRKITNQGYQRSFAIYHKKNEKKTTASKIFRDL